MLPKSFSSPPPRILAFFQVLFKNTIFKKTGLKGIVTWMEVPLIPGKFCSMLEDTVWHLPRLHLHILSCSAINVTTGMCILSQYTECTMPNLFFERENCSSTCQLSHFTRICSLPKNAKTEEENLVLSSLASCLGRRSSIVPQVFSITMIPSRPPRSGCFSTKLQIMLPGRGTEQTSSNRCASLTTLCPNPTHGKESV